MKRTKTLALVTALLVLLMVSGLAYCENNHPEDYSIKKRLKEGSCKCDDGKGTCLIRSFSITLEGESPKFTLYLVIPRGIEISDVNMVLSSKEGQRLTDVKIYVDEELIDSVDGEFQELEIKGDKENGKKLIASVKKYLEEDQSDEEEVEVPIVFVSAEGGEIIFGIFSLGYEIGAVDEVYCILDDRTEFPVYFFWRPIQGLTPKCDLEIHPTEDFSTDSLLKKRGIVNIFYKMTENDLYKDSTEDEPTIPIFKSGKTYYFGVRTNYTNIGVSQWKKGKFTIRPDAITGLKPEEISETETKFEWNPVEADNYCIALNGKTIIRNLKDPSYTVDITSNLIRTYLCPCGENVLTVWAETDGKKGEAADHKFNVIMDKLPDPIDLKPNFSEPPTSETFSFQWNIPDEAREYVKEYIISFPTGDIDPSGKKVVVEKTVESLQYNPWEDEDADFHMQLKPGEVYTWEVCAVPKDKAICPGTGLLYRESYATKNFEYLPVSRWMLALCIIGGGFLGGFVYVVSEENAKAKKEKRRMGFPKDTQTAISLVIGVIAGCVFYIFVSLTLGTELYERHISLYSYQASFLIGFIGGLISYGITFLRNILPRIKIE